MKMQIDARDRLIVALDVPSAAEAERLVDRMGDHVRFVKVGLELYTVAGPDIVRTMVDRGKRVFLDLKFLDIEETVRRATARVAAMGATFLTVHANRKALLAAVQGRGQSNLKLLAVTVLTNFDGADLQDMGIQRSVRDLVTARALLAAEVGCDGVVASGEEPEAIRAKVGPDLIIVTPGIRPTGTGTDDHARATTPTQTIAAGADYLVVGRPIRDAQDPALAAAAILAEMQAAFDRRVGQQA
ncbi:MAG: orotidine-5'-phosphate decarboxylase [Nitrospira sp.]|jgi:orotidine-5'-phosphate decarboxylase|nr:orotidine-5'-phosphate decarboxylase [Nitrospira sp.]MCC7472213.1 orotidine-5'-phosphate decarboxylase [Candidatus Nomurabacteria bacterium]MBS0159353.1 orotidine-5'-phosphate decarboxylase [Nitrospira sp.]MBS0163490.1 orotidine-5'-phosphate decarboxylase [Nitrospira sp.]MBS0175867.1 orotidine-5'-phosphate decarboxylase [Nitrospira sp.]